MNRGFNTSLGYLAGGEDHYTQQQNGEAGCVGTDFWNTDQPAYGKNGSYTVQNRPPWLCVKKF